MYAFICCKYYINSIYNIKIHKLHFYKLCFELYEKIVFFSFLSIRLIIKLKKKSCDKVEESEKAGFDLTTSTSRLHTLQFNCSTLYNTRILALTLF